jgi:hypothetical protein
LYGLNDGVGLDMSVHSLDYNNLGAEGARVLADALRVNTTLQTLQ